ncbi:hypothetical protein CUMW_014500 [Citrus unshiu]|nr:hypothetical protein CUMW_014500 [Citrus unshiu]
MAKNSSITRWVSLFMFVVAHLASSILAEDAYIVYDVGENSTFSAPHLSAFCRKLFNPASFTGL